MKSRFSVCVYTLMCEFTDHLCKPNLSQAVPPRWKDALERLGHDSNVYMKLSGAFNEFDITPENLEDITSQVSQSQAS